jgi:hypothetical protein
VRPTAPHPAKQALSRHQPGTGVVCDGRAWAQGLATCGECGRKLAVYYEGKHKATPGYYCTGTGSMLHRAW